MSGSPLSTWQSGSPLTCTSPSVRTPEALKFIARMRSDVANLAELSDRTAPATRLPRYARNDRPLPGKLGTRSRNLFAQSVSGSANRQVPRRKQESSDLGEQKRFWDRTSTFAGMNGLTLADWPLPWNAWRTYQHLSSCRFAHGWLHRIPATGIWIDCHIPSVNGCFSFRYPIAHTGGDHTDINRAGAGCRNGRPRRLTIPTPCQLPRLSWLWR